MSFFGHSKNSLKFTNRIVQTQTLKDIASDRFVARAEVPLSLCDYIFFYVEFRSFYVGWAQVDPANLGGFPAVGRLSGALWNSCFWSASNLIVTNRANIVVSRGVLP